MCRKLSCYLTAALALALLAGCGPAAAQPGSQTAPPTAQATLEPTPEPVTYTHLTLPTRLLV